MKIIMVRPDSTRYAIEPGTNHPSTDKAIGIEPDATDPKEDNDALVMLQEIERELGDDKGTSGDWVKFFAAPVAVVLDKEGCLSCEFRRVCMNAGKKLRRIYGADEGKKKMKALIVRSFTEDAAPLGLELKKLLEN